MRPRTFEELNSNYIGAREEWGVHVDNCEACDRSPFACEEGLELHDSMNAAWTIAKREWERIKREDPELAAELAGE